LREDGRCVLPRAAVSPAVFRELFESLDSCFLALLEQVLERSTALVVAAFEGETSWQDGVLAGLEALLVFLDSEPLLARVCLVDALAGPHEAAELRARLLASSRPLLDRGREQLAPEHQPSPLTATATIALVAGILQEQFVERREPVFIGLLGELAGSVVAQYLGVVEARRQVERGNARASVLIRKLSACPVEAPVHIPKEICHARAQRRRLCLAYLAENQQPGDCCRDRVVASRSAFHRAGALGQAGPARQARGRRGQAKCLVALSIWRADRASARAFELGGLRSLRPT
jgi:AcrR family transcriptional regulator